VWVCMYVYISVRVCISIYIHTVCICIYVFLYISLLLEKPQSAPDLEQNKWKKNSQFFFLKKKFFPSLFKNIFFKKMKNKRCSGVRRRLTWRCPRPTMRWFALKFPLSRFFFERVFLTFSFSFYFVRISFYLVLIYLFIWRRPRPTYYEVWSRIWFAPDFSLSKFFSNAAHSPT
jgi:hypothetical protein